MGAAVRDDRNAVAIDRNHCPQSIGPPVRNRRNPQVGAGGFLGLGEHDVAIPYSEISWMYVPGAQSSANGASAPTGAASTVDQNSAGAHPAADKAFMDAASARPYLDHAVINITKEQLKAAPAFKFSR
jgi:hypothetical protein